MPVALWRAFDRGWMAFLSISSLDPSPAEPPILMLSQVKEALLKNIKRRMTPQPLKIRADVELTCFHYDGIEHIKDAMRAAEVRGGACMTRDRDGSGVPGALRQKAGVRLVTGWVPWSCSD